MAKDERCEVCRFAHQGTGPFILCRRFPPSPADGRVAVKGDGWCGEFKGRAGRPKKEDSDGTERTDQQA